MGQEKPDIALPDGRDEADILDEMHERRSHAEIDWQDIQAEAETDMRFVCGDPFDADDKKKRTGRPLVAPEEMGQYRNQVLGQLMKNPRGIKFEAAGGGASAASARFYENKAREIEYRSHAKTAYIIAATNALERSYGFVRVSEKYASPRTTNQEIWIEAFPDPDMVLPGPALRPDSSDMTYCWVNDWMEIREFNRKYPWATRDFSKYQTDYSNWVKGNRILVTEYWTIIPRERTLVLAQPPSPQMPQRSIAPLPPNARPQPVEMFEDELEALADGHGYTVLQTLRQVDYPELWQFMTNGIELLSGMRRPEKYIPIISCYGKIVYKTAGGVSKKEILSMTRFGRDPWKSMCYGACQVLEILGQIPRASVIGASGQFETHKEDWAESPHVPHVYLEYDAKTTATGQQVLPPPARADYVQAENLQAALSAIEMFRRQVQSAMSSNFLPTIAQGFNEKSGVAMDSMSQAASTGTFHFVDNYNDMIRQVGVVIEDKIDKIHDYQGTTWTTLPEGTAEERPINNPSDPQSVSTQGDHTVTVSTGPSSDSEVAATKDFLSNLVGNIAEIAQVAPPGAASKLLAMSIRLQNGGPLMDKVADVLDAQGPTQPPPELQAAQQKIQELTQELQQAQFALKAKQVEGANKLQIERERTAASSADQAADRAVKLDVAAIEAKIETMAMVLDELKRIGGLNDNASQRLHEAGQAVLDKQHEAVESAKDRVHEHLIEGTKHAHAVAQIDAQAANQPPAPTPTAQPGE